MPGQKETPDRANAGTHPPPDDSWLVWTARELVKTANSLQQERLSVGTVFSLAFIALIIGRSELVVSGLLILFVGVVVFRSFFKESH